MSRYIDADALIRDLQERYCRPCKAAGLDYNEVRCRACQFDDEIDDIDGFADNSIDIVRCKECKYCVPYSTCGGDWQKCMRNIESLHDVHLNDFCSYGERRER